jgi:hypothetical protein
MTSISLATRGPSSLLALSDSSSVALPMLTTPVGDSARMRLARLALAAAQKLPAVVGVDAGPAGLCLTADPPGDVLRGVSVIAQADGRYEVDLCLNAKLVPLGPLGAAVVDAVRGRVKREGLELLLGEVNVEFADVLTDAEIAAEQVRAGEMAEQAPERATRAMRAGEAAEQARISEKAAERLPAQTRATEHAEHVRTAEKAAERQALGEVSRERLGGGEGVVVVVVKAATSPSEAIPPQPASPRPTSVPGAPVDVRDPDVPEPPTGGEN